MRAAQEAGNLDPSWDPADVLMLVYQIAIAWAGKTGPTEGTTRADREEFLTRRRAAALTAVQRLFPAAGGH